MLAPSDSIAEFERAFDRRIRLTTVVFITVAVVLVGTFGYLFVAFPGMLPSWFPLLIVAEAVIATLFPVFFRKRMDRVRKFPRELESRLASVSMRGPHPTVVFDNGLVLTWDKMGLQLCLYFSQSGNKAVPTQDELRTYLRGTLRSRIIFRVDRRHGPAALRGRLDRLRPKMASRFSFLSVYSSRSSALTDPTRPAWIAQLTLGGSLTQFEPARVLPLVDELASILEDAAGMARISASALGGASGLG